MPKPTTQPTQPVETARRAAAQNPGLPSLPPGWVWTTLGEVFKVRRSSENYIPRLENGVLPHR